MTNTRDHSNEETVDVSHEASDAAEQPLGPQPVSALRIATAQSSKDLLEGGIATQDVVLKAPDMMAESQSDVEAFGDPNRYLSQWEHHLELSGQSDVKSGNWDDIVFNRRELVLEKLLPVIEKIPSLSKKEIGDAGQDQPARKMMHVVTAGMMFACRYGSMRWQIDKFKLLEMDGPAKVQVIREMLHRDKAAHEVRIHKKVSQQTYMANGGNMTEAQIQAVEAYTPSGGEIAKAEELWGEVSKKFMFKGLESRDKVFAWAAKILAGSGHPQASSPAWLYKQALILSGVARRIHSIDWDKIKNT